MTRRQAAKSPLKDAKNALRPFFGAKRALPRWKQFQAIRASIPIQDFERLLPLVEENRAYKFPGFGNTFPYNSLSIPDVTLRRLTPLSLQRETRLQITRLNYHKDRLVDTLNSLAGINQSLARQEWDIADDLVSMHKAKYGLSLVSVKKELLIALESGGLAGFANRYKLLITGADRRAWGVVCHVLYDLADPAYHPSTAAKVWINLFNSWEGESNWFTDVAKFEILGTTASPQRVSSLLLRYNAVSLLDLLITFWKLFSLNSEAEELKAGWEVLDGTIREILVERFTRLPLSIPARRGSESHPRDVNVYQTSYFFEEFATIAAWRNDINSILFPAEICRDEAPPRHSTLRSAAEIMKEGESGLERGKSIAGDWLNSVLATGTTVAGVDFLSAVVISEYLRSLEPDAHIDERSFVRLMAEADDLHEYVSQGTLEKLLDNESVGVSPLLKFLLRDMIFRKTRTQDNELDRRASFMDIFRGGSKQDIVGFLSSIAEWSPRTAIQIGQVCSRGFLERLYLLMASVKDVIETRIEICDWLIQAGSQFKETLTEEREALERELENLDARSDLDSTRVHVDEESLREWFLDTQQPSAVRYIQTVLAEGPESAHETFLAFYRRLKEKPDDAPDEGDFLLETQIGSEFILLTIAEATLASFVSDRTFGLDSYLSRRIRHGTLSGFLLTPLARIGRKIQDEESAEERIAAPEDLATVMCSFDDWRAEVAHKLDHARRDLIQIRSSKHPEGLIEATWNTITNVTHLDAMMSRVRQRVVEEKGEYDLFPDIHSLCWDLIEQDLAQLRLHMVQGFYKPVSERLAQRFQEFTDDQQILAAPYFREAHTTLESRVLEVCGWFIRPVFRRDSYDLRTLIGSTLSIVRELDANYQFSEEVTLDESILINRGGFEVLGDILFVLIGNAAKHGKRGGNVRVVARKDASFASFVIVEVTSEIETPSDYEKAKGRIREAFSIGERSLLEAAAVDEGFSGIRKIIGLVRRLRSGEAEFGAVMDDKGLKVSFRVRIPAEITFRRERT